MTHTSVPTLKPPVGPHDHVRGPADAPVTLVEYGDYECRHCRAAAPMINELRERFGDRLRYVFRHFPIRDLHPQAQFAAEVAEAAAAQGKFWEMHDLLFAYEQSIDHEFVRNLARRLNLDVDRFLQDLAEHRFAGRVNDDYRSAIRSGAHGAPAFFLNGIRYDGAWDVDSMIAEIERPLGVQLRFIFQQFTRLQASSGLLLLAAAALAILWANSPWGPSYFALWDTYVRIQVGGLALEESLLHWVNDGLMVIFFFLVGLEIKREILVGELASPRRAALPLFAAVGGMALPALMYTILNLGQPGQEGWGIPMATDIAFVLGILTLLGSRVPVSLKIFFTALAIADDLGAVLVLALFYSRDVAWIALALGAAFLALLVVLNRGHVRQPLPYALLGIGVWLAFLQSGIHPTIAGVLLALTIPAESRIRSEAFQAQCSAALRGMGGTDDHHREERRQQAAAQTLEAIAERIQSPLQRLERTLNPWVAYLVIPVFALANAGVDLSGHLLATLGQPLALGVLAGLLLGKPIGITLFSWIAVKIGVADLPYGVSWGQLFAASWLAGIGFTMSLFIASAAFGPGTELDVAKMAILVASLLAGIVGFALLQVFRSRPEGESLLAGAASDA